MSPIEKSGLYYPNKFGLITIKSLEEVMGKNGLNAILNLAGLNHYIDNYPADNLDKGFDFSELSSLGLALEDMYGPRGGRGLALRAGGSRLDRRLGLAGMGCARPCVVCSALVTR